MRPTRLLLALLAALLPEAAQETAPPAATVTVAGRPTISIEAEFSGLGPAARAAAATAALQSALVDPDCDATGITVEAAADGGQRIVACGRTVVEVGAADAAAQGVALTDLAERWGATLRSAWTLEKTARYSRRLIESALLGLAYPVAFLLALWLVRLLVRRLRAAVEKLPSDRGLGLGPLVLLASATERAFLSRLVGLLSWVVYLLLGYVFLIALFDRFPRTAQWASQMLQPLRGLGGRIGEGLLQLAPRLLLLLVLLVATRVVLRALGTLFQQVRAKRLRLDPLLTADTAGPAEVTARAITIGVAAFLGSLLVPGDAGTALLGAFLLVGLAFALGARTLVENLVAGVVLLYGRPFRTGQGIRIAGHEGVVTRKGFLHLTLRGRDDRSILVPNREALLHDVRHVDETRALRLEVVLEQLREDCGPEGLFRHAAAEAGLQRGDGEAVLLAVAEQSRTYGVRWTLPRDAELAATRTAFLEALLARAPGLGLKVVAAREAPASAP